MNKTEFELLRCTHLFVVVEGAFEQVVCADDIALDKCVRLSDGAIDMAFGSEVNDRLRAKGCDRAGNAVAIAEVSDKPFVFFVGFEVCERVLIAGVGEFVKVEHAATVVN